MTRWRMTRRRPCVTFVALAALTIAAPTVETEERQLGPPPGRLVDVQGLKLHIHCTGAGSPTVVIDAGAGAWSIFYAHIQKAVSGARVCTYDRAGYGWSEFRSGPRTSDRMVDELHGLLHAAGVQPPLVLVGHSLGGYNVRVYQARYPEEVAALVLLDAAHEEQWERLPSRARELLPVSAAALRQRAAQARDGLLDAKSMTPPGVLMKHVPELKDSYIASMLTPAPHETLAAEQEGSFDSARQVPLGRRLGDLPLVVLTARHSFDAFKGTGIPVDEANAVWLTMQAELAALSTNSQQLFTEGHHRLNETDPEAVVRAIQLAVDKVKNRPGPAGLRLPATVRPLTSTPVIDVLLVDVKRAARRHESEG